MKGRGTEVQEWTFYSYKNGWSHLDNTLNLLNQVSFTILVKNGDTLRSLFYMYNQ